MFLCGEEVNFDPVSQTFSKNIITIIFVVSVVCVWVFVFVSKEYYHNNICGFCCVCVVFVYIFVFVCLC